MAVQPAAQSCNVNPQKRKADCLNTEAGICIPRANVVPESILQKVSERIQNELSLLRSIFCGCSITLTSADSVEPVLLYMDQRRLPGKAHFGIAAKHNFKRGELIAKETSCQGSHLVPLHETAGHFKMMERLNHSCAPNVIVQFVLAEGEHGPEAMTIKYLASRDILAGEELCKEYFEVCQCLQDRQQLSSFVCSCPVCNLPDEERRISDERREQIKHTAQLELRSIKTAQDAYSLLCKIKDARHLMLLEKIGEGCAMLKLCRLEMGLLHQSKAFHSAQCREFQELLGKSIASWEETIQEESKLSEECSSSGATMHLDSKDSGQNAPHENEEGQEEEEEEEEEEAEEEEQQQEAEQDGEAQLSMHMTKVTSNLEKRLKTHLAAAGLEVALAELADVEDQCKRVGLCANVLEMLDEVMVASEGVEKGQSAPDLSSFSCDVDVDGTIADDPDLQRRMHADVLACMGNYFAVFGFHDFATTQYTAALALDETNLSAKLGLAKVLKKKMSALDWTLLIHPIRFLLLVS